METIRVLFQTEALAVCVKPAGVLSQAGRPGQSCMPDLLSAQLGGEIFPVHRLDREVGGVMVYARTRSAAGDLSRMIQRGALEKEYLAALRGVPEEPAGLLTDLLYHDRNRNKTYVVDRPRKGVKEARLLYRVLEQREGCSLIQVRLLTGRTHQIRAQFASRGLPLLGDGRYGGGSGGPQLWSMALTLPELGRFAALPEVLGPFAPEMPAPWDPESN